MTDWDKKQLKHCLERIENSVLMKARAMEILKSSTEPKLTKLSHSDRAGALFRSMTAYNNATEDSKDEPQRYYFIEMLKYRAELRRHKNKKYYILVMWQFEKKYISDILDEIERKAEIEMVRKENPLRSTRKIGWWKDFEEAKKSFRDVAQTIATWG